MQKMHSREREGSGGLLHEWKNRREVGKPTKVFKRGGGKE